MQVALIFCIFMLQRNERLLISHIQGKKCLYIALINNIFRLVFIYGICFYLIDLYITLRNFRATKLSRSVEVRYFTASPTGTKLYITYVWLYDTIFDGCLNVMLNVLVVLLFLTPVIYWKTTPKTGYNNTKLVYCKIFINSTDYWFAANYLVLINDPCKICIIIGFMHRFLLNLNIASDILCNYFINLMIMIISEKKSVLHE